MFSFQSSIFSFQRDGILGACRRVAGIATLLVMMLPCLAGTAVGAQTAAGIRDAGNFFSPSAIARANDIIYDIHARFGKDLLVETFPSIPNDLKPQYDPQQKAQFFSQWAGQRFTAQNVDGIFILVCRDPSYLDIRVGDQTINVFGAANQNELRQALLNSFRSRNFDQGLTDATEYVRSSLTRNIAALSQGAQSSSGQNSPGQSAPGSNLPVGIAPGSGLGCFGIVLILLAVFVILRLLVTILGGRPSGGGPIGTGPMGPGYGGGYGGMDGPFGYGGGGFGRGMLGGLFGGLAGNWLYDRMFRGPGDYYGPGGGVGSGGEFGGGQGPFGGNDQGQSMDAGGGDFSAPNNAGGSTGSNDFSGGGDFGGGDSGGASNGGGGGDSGGSF
jgi:uncharacterized protein